jgi:tetratricopeptide (TPR) repeat protein
MDAGTGSTAVQPGVLNAEGRAGLRRADLGSRARGADQFKTMAWFRKAASYDRSACLARAARAESRGRPERALEEYRTILEHEPEDSAVQVKLAAALARSGQRAPARDAFAACAERYEKGGFAEKALGVYRQAVGLLPLEEGLWREIARLHLQRGHPPDAHRALLEGRAHCRRRRDRPQAIRLLREALKLDPRHFPTAFDLARQLLKQGERAEAHRLCEDVCAWQRGRDLRRTRALLLRAAPSPGTAWRWLRAVLLGR